MWWFDNRDHFLDEFEYIEKVPDGDYRITGTGILTESIFIIYLQEGMAAMEEYLAFINNQNFEKGVGQALVWEGVMEPLVEMVWRAKVQEECSPGQILQSEG